MGYDVDTPNKVSILIEVQSRGEKKIDEINKKLLDNNKDILSLKKAAFNETNKLEKFHYLRAAKSLKLENAGFILEKKQAIIEQQASKKELNSLKKELKLQDKLNKTTKKGSFDWYKGLLPILFVSQQVSQGLKSMLQPSNDLLGNQEILSDFLAAAFIPTAEKNLDTIIEWGSRLLDLDESTREAMGSTIQYGQVAASGVNSITEVALATKGMTSSQIGVASAILTAGATVGALDSNIIGLSATMGNSNALLLAGSIKAGEFKEAIASASKEADAGGSSWIGLAKVMEKKSSDMVTDARKVKDSIVDIGATMWSTASSMDMTKVPSIFDKMSNALSSIDTLLSNIARNTFWKALEFVGKAAIWIGDKSTGGSMSSSGQKQDFISRPGSPVTSFSPNDTIFGVKHPESFMSQNQGYGGSVTINSPITINATVSSGIDMNRLSQQIEGNIRQNLLKYSQVK